MNSSSNGAPVLAAMIPIFLSCVNGTHLTDHSACISAYATDPETKPLLYVDKYPSFTSNTAVEHIHCIHRWPPYKGQLYEENGTLSVRDVFNDDGKYSVAACSGQLAKYYL